MITAADMDYHKADPDAFNWVETNAFHFSVPGEGITGYTYVLTRPNIGVCHSSVYIYRGFCESAADALWADARMHLPAPQSLLDYDLPNGLGTTVLNGPNDYNVRYMSNDGACSFNFDWHGIAGPYDPHDEKQNPLRGAAADSIAAGGWGEAWSNGHFDMLGHARGTLTLDGKTYRIDSVDAMDHSWGPRPEWEMGSIGWQMMTFGPDLGFHILLPISLEGECTAYGLLSFGHMCENGKVIGLVSARVETVKHGRFPKSQIVTVKDELGREWTMKGEAIAWAPWHTSYPSFIIWGALFRWTMGDRTGESNVMEVYGTGTLGRLARAAIL